eukprot:1806223-Pyramimonas_sp.AAC.1
MSRCMVEKWRAAGSELSIIPDSDRWIVYATTESSLGFKSKSQTIPGWQFIDQSTATVGRSHYHRGRFQFTHGPGRQVVRVPRQVHQPYCHVEDEPPVAR